MACCLGKEFLGFLNYSKGISPGVRYIYSTSKDVRLRFLTEPDVARYSSDSEWQVRSHGALSLSFPRAKPQAA